MLDEVEENLKVLDINDCTQMKTAEDERQLRCCRSETHLAFIPRKAVYQGV